MLNLILPTTLRIEFGVSHNTNDQRRYNETNFIYTHPTKYTNLISSIYCILQLGHLLSQDLEQDKKLLNIYIEVFWDSKSPIQHSFQLLMAVSVYVIALSF